MRGLASIATIASLVCALAACHRAPREGMDAPLAPDALGSRADARPDAPPGPPPDAFFCKTVHAGPIDADETWAAAGSPHCIQQDLAVDATVTIEAGAVVALSDYVSVTVGVGGALDAQGTPTDHVTVTSTDGGGWTTLSATGGDLSLVYTDLRYGGTPAPPTVDEYTAVVDASASGGTGGSLHVDHTTIDHPGNNGIHLHDGGVFDDTSTTLTIRQAFFHVLVVSPAALATIPADASFDDLGSGILIDTGYGAVIDRDTHLRSLGALYSAGTLDPHAPGFGSSLPLTVVGATGVATLTLDAGVTLGTAGVLIDPDRASDQPARAALVALGNAADPVILNGPEVTLGGIVDPATRIDYAQLDPGASAPPAPTVATASCPYPGLSPINNAELRILGAPATQFITHSQIISFSNGIDRGYRSDTKIDLAPTNRFVLDSSFGCEQTDPADADGSCPASPPCVRP